MAVVRIQWVSLALITAIHKEHGTWGKERRKKKKILVFLHYQIKACCCCCFFFLSTNSQQFSHMFTTHYGIEIFIIFPSLLQEKWRKNKKTSSFTHSLKFIYDFYKKLSLSLSESIKSFKINLVGVKRFFLSSFSIENSFTLFFFFSSRTLHIQFIKHQKVYKEILLYFLLFNNWKNFHQSTEVFFLRRLHLLLNLWECAEKKWEKWKSFLISFVLRKKQIVNCLPW